VPSALAATAPPLLLPALISRSDVPAFRPSEDAWIGGQSRFSGQAHRPWWGHGARRVRPRDASGVRAEPAERGIGHQCPVARAAGRADVPLHLVPGDREARRDGRPFRSVGACAACRR